MSDQVPAEQKQLMKLPQRTPFRPYRSLLQISRKIGHTATQTGQGVRGILTREIALPNREQLFGGNNPAQKSTPAREAAQLKKTLQQIVKESHEILAEATTVWPFTLFPDKVIVDRTKITIRRRTFFWSEDLISIRIEDVLNVLVSTDILFGSLNIASRVMNSTDHFQITFLRKRDAMHLKHIIQGYVIAQHNQIKISHLPKDELIQHLLELGDDTAP